MSLFSKHTGAQHKLKDENGHLPDILKLLGTAEGLRKYTYRLMQRGILGQFTGGRDALYDHPFSFSSAQD